MDIYLYLRVELFAVCASLAHGEYADRGNLLHVEAPLDVYLLGGWSLAYTGF